VTPSVYPPERRNGSCTHARGGDEFPTGGLRDKVADRPGAGGPGWTQNEAALELRLADDEARFTRDEARLTHDEARIDAEAEDLRSGRMVAWIGIALAFVLAVAVVGLVIALIALQREVHLNAATAGENTVGISAIQDSAVTADVLAKGAVTAAALGTGAVGRDAVADSAVGGAQLAADAVTGTKVARDSLTGADVRETSLGTVSSALVSQRARTADNATALGGLPSSAYVSDITTVRATSGTDARRTKGPLSAQCPVGTRVMSGGATVHGAVRGVAIVRSAPRGPSSLGRGCRHSPPVDAPVAPRRHGDLHGRRQVGLGAPGRTRHTRAG
jgi:hypothetical protein